MGTVHRFGTTTTVFLNPENPRYEIFANISHVYLDMGYPMTHLSQNENGSSIWDHHNCLFEPRYEIFTTIGQDYLDMGYPMTHLSNNGNGASIWDHYHCLYQPRKPPGMRFLRRLGKSI